MFNTSLKKISALTALISYMAFFLMVCFAHPSSPAIAPVAVVFEISLIAAIALNIGDFMRWLGRNFRGE